MEKIFMEVARGTSGYRKKEMAKVLGVKLKTYRKIENNPGMLCLDEIRQMLPQLNSYSVKIIHEAIDEIFLPYE